MMRIPSKICSSCGACANVCSQQAITMQLDCNGFYRPFINQSKCIQCGLCERSCPWQNIIKNSREDTFEVKVFAAQALDEEIRKKSSSGGLFSVFSKWIINQGGIVAGVSQKDPYSFEFIIVDNVADLEKLRGSKYVQANPSFVYREIKRHLKEGKKVLFSGSSCHVAALYAVLGNKVYENLWTIDIVCHGVPSIKVYKKFIKEQETQQKSLLRKTIFRNKSTGWSTYSVSYFFENETCKTVNVGNSEYMALFLSRICQNESCGNCLYRKIPRIGDITLGDYWRVSKYHKSMDDNLGTSLVLINNSHGEMLFSSISRQIKCCESALKYALHENPCISESFAEHSKRSDFFSNLDCYPLKKLVKKYFFRFTFWGKVYYKTRSFFGELKQRLC